MRNSPARIGCILLAIAILGLSACYRGAAPANALIDVVNLGSTGASVHWQASGLFGASGTEPVSPCRDYARGFPPGDEQIVIATATDSESFTLSASAEVRTEVWYVIDANGKVRATTGAAFPKDPCPSDHGPS